MLATARFAQSLCLDPQKPDQVENTTRIGLQIAFAALCIQLSLFANDGPTATAVKLDDGFEVGNSIPVHLVRWLLKPTKRMGGAPGGPSVNLYHQRARGVEIWSKETHADTFTLAKEVESRLPADEKAHLFLVLYQESLLKGVDDATKDKLLEHLTTHGLKRCFLCTARNTTRLPTELAEFSNDSSVLVYFLDGKKIERKWRLKQSEVTEETIRTIAAEAEAFLAERS